MLGSDSDKEIAKIRVFLEHKEKRRNPFPFFLNTRKKVLYARERVRKGKETDYKNSSDGQRAKSSAFGKKKNIFLSWLHEKKKLINSSISVVGGRKRRTHLHSGS